MEKVHRPPRPKAWTMQVVATCRFLHVDQEDQLLDFRDEYRKILRLEGRRRADHFARVFALKILAYSTREMVVTVGIIAKRIVIG